MAEEFLKRGYKPIPTMPRPTKPFEPMMPPNSDQTTRPLPESRMDNRTNQEKRLQLTEVLDKLLLDVCCRGQFGYGGVYFNWADGIIQEYRIEVTQTHK